MATPAATNPINVWMEPGNVACLTGMPKVLLQSDTIAGIIAFEATDAGLWKGSTDIVTVPTSNEQRVTIDKDLDIERKQGHHEHPEKVEYAHPKLGIYTPSVPNYL